MKVITTHKAFPEALVREIIEFVRPSGCYIKQVRITAHRYKSRGLAWPTERRVLARITTHAESWPRVPSAPDAARVPGKGYLPWPYLANATELLVMILAHEVRHLWQADVPRGRRVWGSRGQYSERDADAYAIRLLRAWRRRPLAPLSE
jgi:hypothetical protein